MPEMSGRLTYEALQKAVPGIKVLLSSGCSIEGQAQELLDSGCNGFIQKPFDAAVLSAKVREILQRARDA
jgi:DNA-binding NarL/FixJ family response regulator